MNFSQCINATVPKLLYGFRSLLIILLLAPLTVIAQKWEIRLGAGATYMTLPKQSPYFTGQHYRRPYNIAVADSVSKISVSSALSVSLSCRWKTSPYTLGLRLGLADLKRYNYGLYAAPQDEGNVYVGRPAVLAQPFVSYTYKGFCGGIQIGALGYFGKGAYGDNFPRHTGSGFIGFAGGAHLGYEYLIVKGLHAFIDLSCNYDKVKQDYGDGNVESNSFFQPAAVLGFGYRL